MTHTCARTPAVAATPRAVHRAPVACLLALVVALLPKPAAPQTPAAVDPVVAAVRRSVDSGSLLGTLDGARWPRITDIARDLRRAYDSTGWTPLWLRDGRPTPQARAVVRYVVAVDSVGLHAADYDAALLDSLDTRLARTADSAAAARFEVALSVAAARVLASLQWGRVIPRDAHETFDVPRLDYDLATALVAAARSPIPGFVFDGAQPRFLPYVLLKRQLARYRALAADSSLRLTLPVRKRVAEGDPYPDAGALRHFLHALGDLPADTLAPSPGADTLFDATLAAGIRSFQARHGATPDGIIGPATRAELLRPFGQRVAQIELSLERWRWLPREFGGRVVFVNVPEFRLYAFDRLTSDSTAVFSMDVVVGDAFDHQTPIFRKELQYLVIGPYWEVPTSIAVKEIRPKAVRDPEWLRRNRYVLALGSGNTPIPLTAENVARIGRGVRVRQLPGPNNALGRVKFMLPNRHNIYLHDTPSQQTFAQARRDASHGCIRLAEPLRLATWLLRDDPRWPEARIAEAMDTRVTPLDVPLPERVPVLVVYGTAVATLAGDIRFLPDIYGHDRTLERLLARGYPYPR